MDSGAAPDDPIEQRTSGAIVPVQGSRHVKRHRTWPQRLVLVFNSVVSIGLIGAGTVVYYANNRLGDRKLVDINSAAEVQVPVIPSEDNPGGSAPATTDVATTEPAVTEPLPPEAKKARNFLLTASDSRECIDPNSPYAGAFGTADIGERADTIMVLRVDPSVEQAAILSFPRDLWVKIPQRGSSRINSALDKQNPNKLIETLYLNFGIPVDHYINVDFCAFKGLVDAVDGVAIPFEYAAKDKNTGLNVDAPGCRTLKGDEALAYVRSRHYQYQDPNTGKWKTDGTSDLGRITRQQDFLKRTLQKAIDRGARNPVVAKGLMDTFLKYVTTDSELTLKVMLDLANAMKDFDANTVRSFQIEGKGVRKGNASVLQPQLNSQAMKDILRVFRGQATLLNLPAGLDPSLATTTTASSSETTTTTTAAPASTDAAPPTSVVAVADNDKGIFPPDDPTCH